MVTAANIIEELLSGMASGLFQRVREEKGLAYFVGATRVETADQGMFYLYAGTTQEAATQVVDEMKAELARISNGQFKKHEIEDAKRTNASVLDVRADSPPAVACKERLRASS
jgi:zinc protease